MSRACRQPDILPVRTFPKTTTADAPKGISSALRFLHSCSVRQMAACVPSPGPPSVRAKRCEPGDSPRTRCEPTWLARVGWHKAGIKARESTSRPTPRILTLGSTAFKHHLVFVERKARGRMAKGRGRALMELRKALVFRTLLFFWTWAPGMLSARAYLVVPYTS